jgi:hypothetical protein
MEGQSGSDIDAKPKGDNYDNLQVEMRVIKDHIASIAQAENRAMKYFATSTTIFAGFLVLIFGINAYNNRGMEGAIVEAKKEVREIAGSIRPDHVSFGRMEPGDSNNLVFFMTISYGAPDEGEWTVILETKPYVEVVGNRGSFIGWRFSLDGVLLDWITNSGTFRDTELSPGEETFQKYKRADWTYGRVSLHTFGETNAMPVTVPILPEAPYPNAITLYKPYRTCEEALQAAEKLIDANFYETGLSGFYLAPLVVQHPVKEKKFRAEIVPTGDYEGFCNSDAPPPETDNEGDSI